MPVRVVKRAGKYRLVEPSGRIAKTHLGHAVDGGGGKNRSARDRQAGYINEAQRAKERA
jgi:hypothetical protein